MHLNHGWLHQPVKFDFMADLTGTGNCRRSNKVTMLANDSQMIIDTCVRNFYCLLCWVGSKCFHL